MGTDRKGKDLLGTDLQVKDLMETDPKAKGLLGTDLQVKDPMETDPRVKDHMETGRKVKDLLETAIVSSLHNVQVLMAEDPPKVSVPVQIKKLRKCKESRSKASPLNLQ